MIRSSNLVQDDLFDELNSYQPQEVCDFAIKLYDSFFSKWSYDLEFQNTFLCHPFLPKIIDIYITKTFKKIILNKHFTIFILKILLLTWEGVKVKDREKEREGERERDEVSQYTYRFNGK